MDMMAAAAAADALLREEADHTDKCREEAARAAAARAAAAEALHLRVELGKRRAAAASATVLRQARVVVLIIVALLLLRVLAWWYRMGPNRRALPCIVMTFITDCASAAYVTALIRRGMDVAFMQFQLVLGAIFLLDALIVLLFFVMAGPQLLRVKFGVASNINTARVMVDVWTLGVLASVVLEASLCLCSWRVYREMRVAGIYPPLSDPLENCTDRKDVRGLEFVMDPDQAEAAERRMRSWLPCWFASGSKGSGEDGEGGVGGVGGGRGCGYAAFAPRTWRNAQTYECTDE